MRNKHDEFLRKLKQGNKKVQIEQQNNKNEILSQEADLLELQKEISKRFDELFGTVDGG